MSVKYKRVEELPKLRREIGSEYDQIIEQFLGDEGAKYAEISKEGIKLVSLVSSLKSRINKKKLTNKIAVKQIQNRAYLVKLK